MVSLPFSLSNLAHNAQIIFYLQSLEYVRLSRGELDRREQAISSLRYLQLVRACGDNGCFGYGIRLQLTVNWRDYIYLIYRAENLKLQTKIRELEQGAENYALVSELQP